MTDATLILIILVVIASVLGLAFFLLKYIFLGAVSLFVFAGESNFLGLAAYFACWVFMFPLMLIASIIIGVIVSHSDQAE
ncbi:MAG: hypothetical protein KAR45_22795 [Desulfobacteraceae bacterium]|nr:hypothetical protein [Desulfobacteraceae bacterium]